MAGTKTYLTLVNNVLQELNEVELTSSTFSSSRGIQTAVKTFVNKAVNDLYTAEVEWPWLYTSTTQDVNSGQQEYTFPSAFRLVLSSADVPTCILNACPVPTESKALTCILYVLFTTVDIV